MQFVEVFKFPIYSFTCDEKITNEVLSEVEKLDYRANVSNQVSIGDFYHKELICWFDQCLNEIKTANQIDSNIDFPITGCWANKTAKLMKHHAHSHPNSFLSGIFYLTENTGSETVFVLENFLNKHYSGFNIGPEVITGSVAPTKGTLIVFPSYLTHSVNVLKSNEFRYTIAFNAFIQGTLSTKNTTQLTLKTTSLHEKYET